MDDELPTTNRLRAINAARELPFVEGVWAIVALIPTGKVLGFGDIAALLGKPNHARQAGFAMSSLPQGTQLAWWRVVRSDGSIPAKTTSKRGREQRAKLNAEDVCFSGKKINMVVSKWEPKLL